MSMSRDRPSASFATRIFRFLAQDIVLPAKVTVAQLELLLSLYQDAASLRIESVVDAV